MTNGVFSSSRWGARYNALRKKLFTCSHEYDKRFSLLGNEKLLADLICGTCECDPVGNLDMFEKLPASDMKKYLLLIPGANDPRRRWEPEKFAGLAAKIAVSHQLDILISGSPTEKEAVEKCCDALPEDLKEHTFIRQPKADKLSSVKQLMSDVKHASWVITNDTGPMHIAAKYGVKTFCITGGWHWGVFAPCAEYTNVCFIHKKMECYGCDSLCKYRTTPFACLGFLTVEGAIQAAAEEL